MNTKIQKTRSVFYTEEGKIVVSKSGNILGKTSAVRNVRAMFALCPPNCTDLENLQAAVGQGHLKLFPEFTDLNTVAFQKSLEDK